jgi:hypothetical protein
MRTCSARLLAAAYQGAHACIAASWIGGVSASACMRNCSVKHVICASVRAELLYLQASEQKSASNWTTVPRIYTPTPRVMLFSHPKHVD